MKREKKTPISLRIPADELADWKAAAKRNGVTLTDYIRRKVAHTGKPGPDPRIGRGLVMIANLIEAGEIENEEIIDLFREIKTLCTEKF
jgi:hypothetical protein